MRYLDQVIRIRGLVQGGLGHFRTRMTDFREVFGEATGESLFAGTLNVRVTELVSIRDILESTTPLPPSRNFCSLDPSSKAKTYVSGMGRSSERVFRASAYRRCAAVLDRLFLGIGDDERLREPVVQGLGVRIA